MLLNVVVRLGGETIFNTKVDVTSETQVLELKGKICIFMAHEPSDRRSLLFEDHMIVVYGGLIMEDEKPICVYEVFDGATVHVFKKIKNEKVNPLKIPTESDLVKVGVSFRSLSLNSAFKSALTKLSDPEEFDKLLLSIPGLSNDPVAMTLIQHTELLAKLSDHEVVKLVMQKHPSLIHAVLRIAAGVHEDPPMLNRSEHLRSIIRRGLIPSLSEDDVDDMDDSSESDAGSQPVSRNSSFGTFTAAQVATALASATSQQPQPSTSGASTSFGRIDVPTGPFDNLFMENQNPSTQLVTDLSAQLQIMRDMGLTNDALNIEAIRISPDLATAIELVLSGFTVTD